MDIQVKLVAVGKSFRNLTIRTVFEHDEILYMKACTSMRDHSGFGLCLDTGVIKQFDPEDKVIPRENLVLVEANRVSPDTD